jgi:hypothetical protein
MQKVQALMRFATMTLLSIGSLSATASSQAHAQDGVQIINLMPSFWKFWVNARGMPACGSSRVGILFISSRTVFHDLTVPCARDFGNTTLE